jgi:hypothetical protein
VFFDVPGLDAPIVSLGQLKHFNPGGHIDSFSHTFGSIPSGFPSDQERGLSYGPAYAIGESRAHLFVNRTQSSTTNSFGFFRDSSWLLNRELWDAYFFSTLPRTGAFDFSTDLSGNPRLRPFRTNLASIDIDAYRDSARAAAANLLNVGAFNINSTSVEAWRALLSSLNKVPYPGTTTELTGAFARSPRQPAGNASANDGVSEDAWSGYRNLSNAEIDALAVAVVDEVKTRGPFRSLSDFVNRRLADDDTGLQGVLDAAIEEAGTNSGTTSPYFDSPAVTASPAVAAHRPTALLAGAPGWLSQGDLLQALAPGLSARSDTFVIRAYGDVRNPATDVTRPEARAWVEAVVQRVPDYVEPAVNTPDQIPASGSNNDRFGRRFEIVSFRWLNPEDI